MSQWTISRKIRAGILVVLMQALCVGCFGLWVTVRTSRDVQAVSNDYVPVTELAGQVERELLNARIHFIYFVTIQKPGALDKGWERFRNAQQELPKLQQLVEKSKRLADTRPQVAQLVRDFESYRPVLERIIAVVQQHRNHGPEFDALLAEWARLGGAMVDSAGRLSRAGDHSTSESSRQSEAQLHSGTLTLEWACAGAFLTGIILTFFIARSVGGGLTDIAGLLDDASRRVADAAVQISGSSQSLAHGASQQAASLEETSAVSEEINSMASRNAANSKSAARNMVETSVQVDEADHNLEQMVASMTEINQSSGKISKIIHVIDEIAFQTNILALNAAVEAARAGEAGLGFAVVADEVRNLAQRCAHAARDTSTLIEESIAKSNQGKMKLDQVAVAVRSIIESTGKVKTLVDEVELGSGEQARGIDQVSKSILEVGKVVQQTAAHAQESAAAGEGLTTQSAALREIVLRLEQMVGR
jgi:methyl-accepting chemotaxis protein